MKWLIIAIITVVTGLPVIFYLNHFSKNGLSDKTQDWANFSGYLSIFVAFCNLILFAFLTFFIHQYNSAKDRNQLLLERPVISFYLDTSVGRFFIHNVGKGPAINVIIKSNLINQSTWRYAVHWYSLPSQGPNKQMPWTGSSMEICATYTDAIGNEYISYMDNNMLRIIDCSDSKSIEKNKNEFAKAQLSSQNSPTWQIPT